MWWLTLLPNQIYWRPLETHFFLQSYLKIGSILEILKVVLIIFLWAVLAFIDSRFMDAWLSG